MFLGLWDTVMSLGSRFGARGAATSIASRSFHVSKKPACCVKHARQALAVDEARYDFRPEIWQDHNVDQVLEQRWFAGVHSNIGGGYVDDGLANIPLRWILKEAENLGLAIDRGFIKHFVPFPQDRLYRSESILYRAIDMLRWRLGRGIRNIDAPATAHLTLDRTVIQRIQADPQRFPELQGKPYRPQNVLSYLAGLSDLKQYLAQLELTHELPEDVNKQLEKFAKAAGR